MGKFLGKFLVHSHRYHFRDYDVAQDIHIFASKILRRRFCHSCHDDEDDRTRSLSRTLLELRLQSSGFLLMITSSTCKITTNRCRIMTMRDAKNVSNKCGFPLLKLFFLK